jgi:serine/threonine protein kinase
MPPAPRIGTMFAGYRIEGLLGQGGMGVVYRAEHPRLGAPVALKVMGPELATDEAFRERFVREARAAARLTHPNIVPIYDAGEWKGDLYLAMRFVDGYDLRSLLRKAGPLSLEQTHAIGLQIGSALDAAHRSGVIHRDVKPANILVEPELDAEYGPFAYLGDLGLTKQIESRVGGTPTGEIVGTIDYMAPEQINDMPVDGRADIYSLACVIFECLTGAPPYVRENQAAVLWGHLHDDVPRATSVNSSLPLRVDQALARGLAKSPDERYSTARELVAGLRAPQGAETIARGHSGTRRESPPALAPTASERGRSSMRGRTVALVGALGLLLGAGTAAPIALLAGDDGPTAASSTTQSRRTGTTTASNTAAFTPFDDALLQYVPDELRPTCRHKSPLTSDFDATLSCRPGGPVSSLTYSHGRSGFALSTYFLGGMPARGLPEMPYGEPPVLTGFCSTGDLPSFNMTVASGLRGRTEVPGEIVPGSERLGLVRCWQERDRARIEWTTREVGVYAAARGGDLEALYNWWRHDAGPEP